MNSKKIVITFLFIILGATLLLLFYLFGQPEKSKSTYDYASINWEQQSQSPETLYKGEVQFKLRCSSCHMMQGQGGRTAPALNDDYWIYGSNYENILYIIRHGSPNRQMMGWDSKLLPEDIIALTVYVKQLNKK